MTRRTKTGQKKHDLGVLKSANYYEKQGYKVQADLPGYAKPKSIGHRIPDVFAKKGNKEIIVEVETKQSVNTDDKQQEKFQNYADRSNNRKFKTKIV